MSIPVFPSLPGMAWPVTRAPVWKTLKQQALSGKEIRIPAYTFPLYKWTIPFGVLRQNASTTEFATLLGFINGLSGGALPFYYQDPTDQSVTGQSFGEGDGTTTAFQLVRAFGGFVEPVQSPNGTPTISVNGTPTSSFTLGAAGVVTFASAPASGATLTWTGSFYWLCRLDDDTAEFSNDMSGLFTLKKLSFTSIKL